MVIVLWDDSQLVVSSLFIKADQCTLQLKLSSSPCLNSLSNLIALGNTHSYTWNKTATGRVSRGASCSLGQPSAGARGPWAGFAWEAWESGQDSAWPPPQSLSVSISPILCSAHLITVHSVDQLSQLLCPVTELASLQFTQLLEMDHSSQVHVLVEERNQVHKGQALGFGSVYPHCWGMGWGETMLPGMPGGCLWTEKGC